MTSLLFLTLLAGASAFVSHAPVPLAGGQRALSRRFSSAEPATPIVEEAEEDEAPPSWSSPGWNWGSTDGFANEEVMRIKEKFEKPHRRQSFQYWAKAGTVDVVDLKMALALSCEQARDQGYDAPDGRWGALVDAMAAAEFMKEEDSDYIDQPKLAATVNEKLKTPYLIDDFIDSRGAGDALPFAMTTEGTGAFEEYAVAVIARALEELEFAQKGV